MQADRRYGACAIPSPCLESNQHQNRRPLFICTKEGQKWNKSDAGDKQASTGWFTKCFMLQATRMRTRRAGVKAATLVETWPRSNGRPGRRLRTTSCKPWRKALNGRSTWVCRIGWSWLPSWALRTHRSRRGTKTAGERSGLVHSLCI